MIYCKYTWGIGPFFKGLVMVGGWGLSQAEPGVDGSDGGTFKNS